jgi:hypothetical protein
VHARPRLCSPRCMLNHRRLAAFWAWQRHRDNNVAMANAGGELEKLYHASDLWCGMYICYRELTSAVGGGLAKRARKIPRGRRMPHATRFREPCTTCGRGLSAADTCVCHGVSNGAVKQDAQVAQRTAPHEAYADRGRDRGRD